MRNLRLLSAPVVTVILAVAACGGSNGTNVGDGGADGASSGAGGSSHSGGGGTSAGGGKSGGGGGTSAGGGGSKSGGGGGTTSGGGGGTAAGGGGSKSGGGGTPAGGGGGTAAGGGGTAAGGGGSKSGGGGGTAAGGGGGTAAGGGGTAAGGGGGTAAGGGGGTAAGGGGGSSGGGGGSSGGGGSGVDAGSGPADVLMMHNHINRDGNFTDPLLTETAAATFTNDNTFNGVVSGNVYATPLYVTNGVGGNGTFYLATENGTIYALDETTGNVDWMTTVATPASQTGTCGNVSPVGITGTPAIDLDTRLIVFTSTVADGSGNIQTYMIYGLSIDTGLQMWAVDATTVSYNGTTFGGGNGGPGAQGQRGAVLILNGIAYVPFAGNYGDCDTYNGWVIGVPLSGTGAQGWATTVNGAGIWGSGGPSSDGTSIFVTTGNGENDMSTYGESEGIFRLGAGPTFSNSTTDYFGLYNWQSLDNEDNDLSGSMPLVIDAPSMAPNTALILGQGKDGNVYLLDRTDLGGVPASQGAQTASIIGQMSLYHANISNAGAWATIGDATYFVVRPNGNTHAINGVCPGTTGDIVAVQLNASAENGMTVAWCGESNGNGSPSITTTDGTNDAMVWAFSAEGNGSLYAWDLLTGTVVLNGGGNANNVRHFTAPIAVHGRIFVGGDNQLYAFAAQ